MVRIIGVIVYLLIVAVAVSGQGRQEKPGANGQTDVPNFGKDFSVGGIFYDYSGCFQDNANSHDVIPGDGIVKTCVIPNNSPERCAVWCQANAPTTTVFGVQNGDECWCGDAIYGRYGQSRNCTTVCPGEPQRSCGGMLANVIYVGTAIPPGGPTITSVEAEPCNPADVITITGTGFTYTIGTVHLVNTELVVIAWWDTQIIVALPIWVGIGHILTVKPFYGIAATWTMNCTGEPPRVIYPAIVSCHSWGDPHMGTYGGLNFDLQIGGEFIMTRVGEVEIQTRQVACYGSIFCNSAIALKYKNDVFGVYGFSGVQTYKNGATFTVPHILDSSSYVALVNGEYHFKFGDITVTVRHWGFFDVIVHIPTNITYSIYPIFGGFCFGLELVWVHRNVTRNTPPVYSVGSQAEIVDIASSWRVTEAESLFDYTLTIEDYDAYNKPGRRQEAGVTTETTATATKAEGRAKRAMTLAAAQAACSVLTSSPCAPLVPQFATYLTGCVVDVSTSGDVGLAEQALIALSRRCVIEHPEVEATLDFPVVASASPIYYPSGGETHNPLYQESAIIIHAINTIGQKDDGSTDQFRLTCNDGSQTMCHGVMATNIAPGEYQITYTPTTVGDVRLRVDLNGATVREWDVEVFDPLMMPIVTEVQPTTIYCGDTITIVGEDLQDCDGTVTINGVELTIISWSETEIIVVLPPGELGTVTLVITNCINSTDVVIVVEPNPIGDPSDPCGCHSSGDPHLQSFTGVPFDFQGIGEYWFTKTTGFDVQVRQSNCGRGVGVSCNTAVAASFGGHNVGFYSVSNVGIVLIDGVQLTGPWPITVGAAQITFDGYGYALRLNGATLSVFGLGGFLNIQVDIVPAVRSVSGGLCNVLSAQWQYGFPDYIRQPITTFDEFGRSWQITDATSLFNYALTSTSWSHHNPNGTVVPGGPRPVDPSLQAAAETICAQLLDISGCAGVNINRGSFYASCVMDIITTGNLAAAQDTLIIWQRRCNPEPVPFTTEAPHVTEPPTEISTPVATTGGCVIPSPQDLHTSVAPYIGASVNPTTFKVVVYVKKVQTRAVDSMTFTHHTGTPYDYHFGHTNVPWLHEDVVASCLDKFTVEVPMTDLASAHISHVAGTYHFAGSLWVNTNETLDDGTLRFSTYELRFDFTFPIATTSSIAIEIISNVDVRVTTQKVILQQAQEDRTIDVTLEVGVMHPHQLNWVHDVLDIDGVASFPEVLSPNVEYLDGTTVTTTSIAITDTCTNAPSTVCKQKFKFKITPPANLCNADGRYVVSLAADRCVDDAACLTHDGNQKDYKAVTVTMFLELGKLCADSHDFSAVELSELLVHSDAARTVTPSYFEHSGDPHELVYFSTDASSPDAECSVSAIELLSATATCHSGNCVAGTVSNQLGNVVIETSPPETLHFHIPVATLTFAPLSASSVVVTIRAVIYFDCSSGKREIRYVHAEIPNVAAEAHATLMISSNSEVQLAGHNALNSGVLAGIVVGGVAAVVAVAVIAAVVIKGMIASAAANSYTPISAI